MIWSWYPQNWWRVKDWPTYRSRKNGEAIVISLLSLSLRICDNITGIGTSSTTWRIYRLSHLPSNKRRSLITTKYTRKLGIKESWRFNYLVCGYSSEAQNLMNELHNGLCEGHFLARTTMYKIPRVDSYWRKIFFDVHTSWDHVNLVSCL